MDGAFYIGAIGMDAQQRALQVVANNIANINTVGFKRSTVRFNELTAESLQQGDVTRQARLEDLSGVVISQTPRVWTAGDLRQTGQPMDVAIDGSGFIELLGPSGQSLLWRGGTLKVNSDGFLAAADGSVLRGMISIPEGATDLSINATGVVTATVDGESRQLGQIELVTTRNPDELVAVGDGIYEVQDAANTTAGLAGEAGAGRFVQGALESSNVQLTDEMLALLLMQRAYAANAQVVQAGDQLMQIVNGLRR